MSPYTYSPLDTAQAELRLIRLLPGNVDDNISLNIFHVPLPFPQQAIDTRMRLQELQRTLPHNCLAKETLDGRYLFMTLGTAGVPNTWDHPDPNFDRSLYEKREQSSDYKPKYEALSYTWGITEDAPSQEESPVIPYVAQVLGDNGESQGNLALGDNLAKALKHLRYRDRPRALWTDAICINQADIQERSAQVKRMCDIYSLAERVVLWLGPEENGSAHAIRTLDYFSKQVEYVVDGSIGDAPGAEQLKWWQSSFPLPYDERTWSALVAIFRRSWFTRVWVLQEAQLASASSIVQCGLDTVPWASLRKSMFALVDREGAPTELRLLFSNYTDGVTGNKDHIFKSLLSWARSRDCTDPRDRVYGILGLAPQSVTDKLQPNYSVSAAEVYRDTLLAYTAAYTSLDLLQQCRISHRCRKAPSWIPNWSEIVRHTFFSHELGYARSSASVSAPSIEYIAPRTLRVTGTLCGHIEPGSRVIDGNIQQILEGIHKWAPESIHTSTYVTGEPFFDSFIDLLCLVRQ